MSDRLLVDHGRDGRVSVSAWFDGELAPSPASQPFEVFWPLHAEALDDLRWYLEEYLRAPFGVYGDRGPKVAAQLRPWGEAIFGTLFGSGPARDAYVRVRARSARVEVVLRSSSPAFLGLPWELLADPARPTPLALDLMGVTRSLPAEGLPAAFNASGERLRVLMVISRPRASADVGYRMIARPLLDRLDAVRGQVDLVVLRPPTLQALERMLTAAKAEGQPFQIVHFDGHGVMAGRGRQALGAGAPVAYLGTEVEGVLAFEKPGGGSDEVSAGTFAQVLSAAEVPVVVLNACQSGAVGTELEAAVATRLLQEGAASVVAMGYTVYAVAAAEFMAAFYERLFAGDGITRAVAAGRRRLYQRPERHSPKGLLPLDDWVVPVHYRGGTPALDDVGRQELREFFVRLTAGGASSVIITSRTKEEWLGEVCRISVGGLADDEAIEYANNLLASFPDVGPRRATRAFGELLRWLDGHPLSMRLVLPHLQTTESEHLLDALGGVGELPGLADDEAERTTSLGASITYSFSHLGSLTRRLLLAVCLFQGVADVRVLAILSQAEGAPGVFAGASKKDWADALDDAARVGLLAPMGAGMYRVHPAVPAYVAALWRNEDPDGHRSQRDAATRGLLTAYAFFGQWLRGQITGGEAGLAITVIELQRHTLGHLLGYALENELWDEAEAIGQPLDDYWRARGLSEEAGGWVDRVRVAVEGTDGLVPEADSPAGALWLLFVSSHAIRQLQSGQLDAAEETCQEILATLETDPASPSRQRALAGVQHLLGAVAEDRGRLDDAEDWYRRSQGLEEELGDRPGMAISYHQLGMVAQKRGDLDEADDWYRRSLGIKEELGDQRGMAASYNQLGVVAQYRGFLDETEQWYRRSLTIEENLGDRRGMAGSYHQLGVVAQLRGRLDEAMEWYRRSLGIKEELGDQPGMASSYHQLGMVAQDRERLDEAEQWYRRSLGIREQLGDQSAIAGSYHHLGTVAQDRGRLDEAEEWYRRSLGVTEELGNRPGMAATYGQLGLLAEVRGRSAEALEWTVRCVATFTEFPHPATGRAPGHLARLTAALGVDALAACWRMVTGTELPQVVRDFIRSND